MRIYPAEMSLFVAQRLKELRWVKKYCWGYTHGMVSQQDVADCMWISRESYNKLENWKRELKFYELVRLLEFYTIDFDEFYCIY